MTKLNTAITELQRELERARMGRDHYQSVVDKIQSAIDVLQSLDGNAAKPPAQPVAKKAAAKVVKKAPAVVKKNSPQKPTMPTIPAEVWIKAVNAGHTDGASIINAVIRELKVTDQGGIATIRSRAYPALAQLIKSKKLHRASDGSYAIGEAA